jgi:hypothetical protein
MPRAVWTRCWGVTMFGRACDVCGKKVPRKDSLQVPAPERPLVMHLACSKTPRGIDLIGDATRRSLEGMFPPPGRQEES